MSCELVWLKSSDLNKKLFTAGFSYMELPLGVFLEGQPISVTIKANYTNPAGGFFASFYNSRRSSFYCPPSRVLYDMPLTQAQKNQGLNFNPESGVLSGTILDLDAFYGDAAYRNKDIDSETYYEYASRPNPRKITFYAKAYLENFPNIFIEREFFMLVSTNWDSRRRALLIGQRKLKSDFFIGGKKATNEQYYGYLQSRGFI